MVVLKEATHNNAIINVDLRNNAAELANHGGGSVIQTALSTLLIEIEYIQAKGRTYLMYGLALAC